MTDTPKLSFKDVLLDNKLPSYLINSGIKPTYADCSSFKFQTINNKQCAKSVYKKTQHLLNIDASPSPSRINKNNALSTRANMSCGGKAYQKGGERLEKAIYKCMPEQIKKYTKCNVKPTSVNGDIIVEYDLLYFNKETSTIITFEIKGLNKNTCTTERKEKILCQISHQLEHSKKLFKQYKVINVICIVTGSATTVDAAFIQLLIEQHFVVAIGQSPFDAIKCAIKQLNLVN